MGVALMIFESGMHFDFDQASKVGPWACVIAVLGTFLPLLGGFGVSAAFGYPMFPDSFSVGVALAPTSVGMALKLLHEAKALHHYFGQCVMTAAFVDDVLSLIIFSVLFSAGSGDVTFASVLPLILGCIFMDLAIPAAVKVFPPILKAILSKFEEEDEGIEPKITKKHQVLWILMFVTLLAYGQITHLCGTHLWGCFIAGMSFATMHEAHHVWVRQVKRVTVWLIRIFFASTLAWAIPIGDLFKWKAIGIGSLMGIGQRLKVKQRLATYEKQGSQAAIDPAPAASAGPATRMKAVRTN